jgi:hypothetical protein
MNTCYTREYLTIQLCGNGLLAHATLSNQQVKKGGFPFRLSQKIDI